VAFVSTDLVFCSNLKFQRPLIQSTPRDNKAQTDDTTADLYPFPVGSRKRIRQRGEELRTTIIDNQTQTDGLSFFSHFYG
jgi:hypothetical protein